MVVALPRLFGCNQGFRLKNKGHFHVKTKNENKKTRLCGQIGSACKGACVFVLHYYNHQKVFISDFGNNLCNCFLMKMLLQKNDSEFFQPVSNLPVTVVFGSVPEMYVDRAAVR